MFCEFKLLGGAAKLFLLMTLKKLPNVSLKPELASILCGPINPRNVVNLIECVTHLPY